MSHPPLIFPVALVENDFSIHSRINIELEKHSLSDPSCGSIRVRQMPVLVRGDATHCSPDDIVRAVISDQPRLVILDLALAAGESAGATPDGKLPCGCSIFAHLFAHIPAVPIIIFSELVNDRRIRTHLDGIRASRPNCEVDFIAKTAMSQLITTIVRYARVSASKPRTDVDFERESFLKRTKNILRHGSTAKNQHNEY